MLNKKKKFDYIAIYRSKRRFLYFCSNVDFAQNVDVNRAQYVHWLFASAYKSVRSAPCLLSPVLFFIASSNIVFKCFEGLRTGMSNFRSDNRDRKSTLQRSQ